MSDFWTIERIRELLGNPDWPQLSVDDDEVEMYLDGNRSRYSLLDNDGFVYAWIPGERLARLCAAAPAALAWCIDAIETAYALANSYATTNEAQRKRIDELLAKLTRANQRAEAAERDCKTAMDQRDNWRQKAEGLETQIKRENDLWVLMPTTQEAIQLRWQRQKVQPTMTIDGQEILRMNRLSLNAVSVFQCTLNEVPEHAQTVIKQNMTLDDLRIVRDAASRMVQMLDAEIDLRVSQLPHEPK